MDNYSAFMSAGYGIEGLASMGGAYAQAEALRAQGEYQRDMSYINARFARIQAKDVIKRGDKAANRLRGEGKLRVGSQRVAAAAQNVVADDGSALDLQVDTEEAIAADMRTIRNNAWREAWGLRVGAKGMESQGRVAALAGRAQANSTLLTGGLSALGSFTKGGAYAFGGNPKAPAGELPSGDYYTGRLSTQELNDWFDRNRYGR